MKIDLTKIQPGDVVVTGGVGVFSYFIRWVTGGWRDRHNINKVPTHVGIVVRKGGELMIAEALSKGLVLSEFSRYTKSPRRRILSFVHFEMLPTLRSQLNSLVINDAEKEDLRYDWRGVANFVDDDIPQNPERVFCSEYTTYALREYAGIGAVPKNDEVAPVNYTAPFAIFSGHRVREVKGWEL